MSGVRKKRPENPQYEKVSKNIQIYPMHTPIHYFSHANLEKKLPSDITMKITELITYFKKKQTKTFFFNCLLTWANGA